MLRKAIIHFAAYLLALVFIMVGLSKILGHRDFVGVLQQSLLVNDWIGLIAYPVPLLEIIVGIALVIPALRRYGFLISSVLMMAFTAYTIYLLKFAPHVPCGCGGIFKDMSWTDHLYVNTGLLILAVTGSLMTGKNPQGRNPVPLWPRTLFTQNKRRSVTHQ